MTKPWYPMFCDFVPEWPGSSGALHVTLYIHSRPKGWRVRIRDLMNRLNVGKDLCYKFLREAIELGYMERRSLTVNGRFDGYAYFACIPNPIKEAKKEAQGSLDLEAAQTGQEDVGTPVEDAGHTVGTTSFDNSPVVENQRPVKPDTVSKDAYIDINYRTTTRSSANVPDIRENTCNTGNQAFGADGPVGQKDAQGAPKEFSGDMDSLREPSDLYGHGRRQQRETDPGPGKTGGINISATGPVGEKPARDPQPPAGGEIPEPLASLQALLGRVMTADALLKLGPWLADMVEGGASPQKDILPVLRARCAGKRPGIINSPRYFSAAVIEVQAARLAREADEKRRQEQAAQPPEKPPAARHTRRYAGQTPGTHAKTGDQNTTGHGRLSKAKGGRASAREKDLFFAREDMPEFAAWLDYYAATKPGFARWLKNQITYTFDARWPPKIE